jgi:hypothetical protein
MEQTEIGRFNKPNASSFSTPFAACLFAEFGSEHAVVSRVME